MRCVFIRCVLMSAVAASGAVSPTPEWARMVKQAVTLDRNGNYQEAAKACESALRLAAAFEPSDRRVPFTLNRLALIYEELGRFSDALHLYQRALPLVEHSIGKNSQEYASLLNNLSAAYMEQGQFAKAEPLIRETLAIEETVPKRDDAELAKSRSVLADILIKRGKYAEADRQLTQAIHVFENLPGSKRDLGTARNDLALVRRFQKQPEEARRLLEAAVDVIESDAGPGHPALARVLNNLGSCYAVLGLRDQADAAYRQSIEIAEARFGPEHPQYGVMLHNYAGFLRACGRKSEAKALEAHSREAIQQSARRNGVGMTVDVSAFQQK